MHSLLPPVLRSVVSAFVFSSLVFSQHASRRYARYEPLHQRDDGDLTQEYGQILDDFLANPTCSGNSSDTDLGSKNYMVEGSTLYKYNGKLPAGSTAPPWSWETVGSVDVKVDGYTYTWTVPLGMLTTDTSKFVVQDQGYGPFINAFSPKPDDYDCKGSSLCSTPDLVKWCDHAVNTLTRSDDMIYSNS